MEDKNVVLILLPEQIKIICDLELASTDLGEPDYILKNPYKIEKDGTIVPWIQEYSSKTSFKIHSDKIITMTEPKKSILDKYLKMIE